MGEKVLEILKGEDRRRLEKFVAGNPSVGDFLERLTDEQAKAAAYLDGHSVIFAGPGTGKTRTMLAKILTVMGSQRANEVEIAAITFTRSAAREMKTRLESILNRDVRVTISTIHSFAYKVMKETGRILNERIADETVVKQFYEPHLKEIKSVLSEVLRENNEAALNFLEELGFIKEGSVNFNTSMIDSFELFREKYYNFVAMEKYAQRKIPSFLKEEKKAVLYLAEKFKPVMKKIKQTMKEEGYLSFTDVLVKFFLLVSKDKNFRNYLWQRYPYLFVDEFQDVSYLQFASLCGFIKGNVTVVGDDDQSIYTWRAAYPYVLEEFKDVFRAKDFYLTKNFRSHEEVVDLSMIIASCMKRRVPKKIVSVKGPGGGALFSLYEKEEGDNDYVALQRARSSALGYAVSSVLKHFAPSDVAVLIRENSLSRFVEKEILTLGVPVLNLTKRSILEMKEAKWLGWALSVFIYEDAYRELGLLIQESTDKFGEKSLEKFISLAKEMREEYGDEMSYYELVEEAVKRRIIPRASGEFWLEFAETLSAEREYFMAIPQALKRKEIADKAEIIVETLLNLFADVIDRLADKTSVKRAASSKPKKKDLEGLSEAEKERLLKEYEKEIERKKEEIYENLAAAKEYLTQVFKGVLKMAPNEKLTLEEWKEIWELVKGDIILGQNDKRDLLEEEGVKIMTVHQAKGLEFPCVIYSPLPFGESGEEDKRIAYVAVTRGEKLSLVCLSSEQVQRDPFWSEVYAKKNELDQKKHPGGENGRKPT